MALPITVPYTFGNATTAIPLSNLDSDYATVYQAVNGIGNGSVALANVAITGGTISGNTTASNVTVSSGTFTNVTLSNVTISSVSTPITAAEGGTGSSSAFTTNGVVYASSTSALATGSALTFNGSQLNVSYADTGYNAGLIVTNTTNNSASQAKIYAVNNAGDYLSLGRNSTLLGGQSSLFATGNYPLEFYTNSTKQATLDSAGNFGLGVTPSAWSGYKVMQAGIASFAGGSSGAYLIQDNAYTDNSGAGWKYINSSYAAAQYYAASGAHVWRTAPSGTAGNAITFTQAMTLSAGGNLLVGVTAGTGFGERFYVSGSNAGYISRIYNTNASPYGTYMYYSSASPNNTGNEFIACDDTGGNRFTLRSNGGIANYAANNVILSDRREKTNFAPAKSYLETICAIPVQTFNYIDQNLEEDGGLTLGVVAQDVQAVAPELVSEGNWGTKDQPKMRLEIYQTDLQYALMKCIQEQQAIITTLTARITALENK